MKNIIDLRKTQYTEFIALYASTGLKWTSYLLNDVNSSNFLNLIPSTYNLSTFSKEINNLRSVLMESFPLFLDDLIDVKIFNKDKVLFSSQNYLGNIKVFSIEIEKWQKDFSKVQVQIILLEKGESRFKSESLSNIFNTENHLSILDFKKASLEKIKNISDSSLKLKREELNLDAINFDKVISYERFIQFLSLEKYSNEFIMNLDKVWTFDELEVSKLDESLRLFRSDV